MSPAVCEVCQHPAHGNDTCRHVKLGWAPAVGRCTCTGPPESVLARLIAPYLR